MTLASAWIVCASAQEAERIATTLVEERLAACCNILAPVSSIYRWEGTVERAQEVPIIAKTDMASADALIVRVKELHSYDVPAIAIWPISAIPDDYARWIEENTGPQRLA